MNRRRFVELVGGAAAAIAWPFSAQAQQPVRIAFIAYATPTTSIASALRDGLRRHGYIEDQNLTIDYHWLAGSVDSNRDVIGNLVRRNIDAIVTWGTPAVLTARNATSTIPIVMFGVADPVASGLVASLARPGGNVTGVSILARDINSKLVELLAELVPGIRRIGAVQNPENPSMGLHIREIGEAARIMGLELQIASARTPEQYAQAFARFSADGVQGVLMIAEPTLIQYGPQIAALAQQARLPTLFQRRENVEVGGLMSYGANLNDQIRQVATYVDRIVKGAKPADLPVEQPTKFGLVINLKTAKALDFTVPPMLVARADEVIE